MPDVHDKLTRSYNMSMVKGKNTTPERRVRQHLFSKGFRYRIYDTRLPGRPDIVMPKYRAVIFINGCFWHGHESCKFFRLPDTRKEWWKEKIEKTRARDRNNVAELEELGWKVFVIWECEVKGESINDTISKLLKKIIQR
jgi:DNA mismatch endonuclease (patch repair protein)